MKKLLLAIVYLLSLLLITATESSAAELYFPHIASVSTWETEVGIINTGETQLQGTLFAYNDAGTLVESLDITLPAKGRTELTVGEAFQNPSQITNMKLDAGDAPCSGYEKFYQASQRVAIPAVSNINTGDLYVTHIASDSTWWTGLALLNTTTTTKELTISFSDGSQDTLTLAAGQHWAGTIQGSFPNINAQAVESAVISNASGVIGLELFGSHENTGYNYLSGILLSNETASTLYYPHVASDSQWWTGIVAYNPNDTPVTLTITPYDDQGTQLETRTVDVTAKGKYVGTASGLNLPAGTVWFKVEGSAPIAGFELFGTNNGKQLAGYSSVNINTTSGSFARLEKDGWTGIAFVNSSSSATTVILTAKDNNGSTIATSIVDLPANGKQVALAQDFFTADISAANFITFSSDQGVVGFQLNGSADEIMLDGLPGSGNKYSRNRTLSIDVIGSGQVITSAQRSLACTDTYESSYALGSTITLEAIASDGSTFSSWTGCDQIDGRLCTVIMDQDKQVSPSFTKPAIYQDGAVELDADAMAQLISVNDDSLTFSADISYYASFGVGDTLYSSVVSDLAAGLLRKVVSIQEVNGQIIVQTTRGMIEDVIQEGAFASSSTLSEDNTSTRTLARGVVVDGSISGEFNYTLNDVLLDNDGDLNTTNDQLSISGSFKMNATLYSAIDIGLTGIKSFKFIAETGGQTDLQIYSSGKLSKSYTKTLHTFTIAPIILGPVVIVPEVALIATASASVASEVGTGVTIGLEITGGTIYRKESGWKPVGIFKPTWGYTPPSAQITVAAKASVGPSITTKLYGIAGPSISLDGYIRFDGELNPATTEYNCSLKAGIDSRAGAKLSLSRWVLAEADITLGGYSKELYNCGQISDSDDSAPTIPTGLTLNQITPTSASLSWNQSSDNVSVNRYAVYQNGFLLSSFVSSTSYLARGLLPETEYCYNVLAYDVAGNYSPLSDLVCGETSSITDTTPPLRPNNLQVNAGTNQIKLSWSPSTSNDVEGYMILRDGQLVDTTSATMYADTNVNKGFTYCYEIQAFDQSGNHSLPSNQDCGAIEDDVDGMRFEYSMINDKITSADFGFIASNYEEGAYEEIWFNSCREICNIPDGTFSYYVDKGGQWYYEQGGGSFGLDDSGQLIFNFNQNIKHWQTGQFMDRIVVRLLNWSEGTGRSTDDWVVRNDHAEVLISYFLGNTLLNPDGPTQVTWVID